MKKFIYFCALIFLSFCAMAQIDPYDRNWDTIFYDDFSTTRYWNSYNWRSMPDRKWKALADEWITHGLSNEHQFYQYQNCVFDAANNTMKLVSEYDWEGKIPTHNYSLPYGSSNYPNYYGSNTGSNNTSWYYFSGEIDVNNNPFHYGYFEIRCKLPIHPGSFPAFWLHGANNDTIHNDCYYNEIDIFEYSNSIFDSNYYYNAYFNNFYTQFTCGIYCDNDNYDMASHAKVNPILPSNVPDLRQYHVFSCEWLPYSVKWFVDGILINDYYVRDSIPHHEMNLRIDYAIDSWAYTNHSPDGQPDWMDGDVMTIDYIKVCQLDTHCDTDAVITSQSDLDNFDYAVMRSIAISPTSRYVAVRSTDHMTFRATDYIEIEAPFTVEYGGEFTVIIQECPDN